MNWNKKISIHWSTFVGLSNVFAGLIYLLLGLWSNNICDPKRSVIFIVFGGTFLGLHSLQKIIGYPSNLGRLEECSLWKEFLIITLAGTLILSLALLLQLII